MLRLPMKVDIILRTHDKDNVHNFSERYCNADKRTVVIKCVTSLLNAVDNASEHTFHIKVLDDRSAQDTISVLDDKLKNTNCTYEIVNLVNTEFERPYNHSALKQFESCRDSTADLVYSVEDDYLHHPTALKDMLDSYEIFKTAVGTADVCIFPYNSPDLYSGAAPAERAQCQIGYGAYGFWRTGNRTTNTIMTTPAVFRKYWNVFHKLATEYHHDHTINEVAESNTINLIWARYVPLFVPITSLALHMQFLEQQDRFIDWEYWWENYTK